MTNKVVKKIVLFIKVKTASPICVSSGRGGLTDMDVLRDYVGNPFISGSSLVGAMRSYIDADSTTQCVFGNGSTDSSAENDLMSSVYVSDLTFLGKPVVTVRDSVKLTEDKTAETGAKFDMEIVDTGTEGSFSMELIIRELDYEENLKNEIRTALYGIKVGEVRFGSKKTRGYGELAIEQIVAQEYDASNILSYADTYQLSNPPQDFKRDDTEIWTTPSSEFDKYVRINIPVRLKGCITIRQYAAKSNEPDYVHISADGKPVIPGTSLVGPIRHRCYSLLKNELGIPVETVNKLLNKMFGYVSQTQEKTSACRSCVVAKESILEGSSPIELTRNAISRFEAGTKEGALFTERAYYGGTTNLCLWVEKGENIDGMIGILLLALKDLQNGFLNLGGQGAVGKGIFEKMQEITLNGENMSEQKYLQAVAEWIGGLNE